MRYFLLLLALSSSPLLFGSEPWTVEGRTQQLSDPARIIAKLFDDVELFLQKPGHLDDQQHAYLTEMAYFFQDAPIAGFDVARTGKAFGKIVAVAPYQSDESWALMHMVLGYRWLDALREAGDRQIRRKLILELFADPRHPCVSFSVAGAHCDALQGAPGLAVREVIWRALRAIPKESKALVPGYLQKHPEDQSGYEAAQKEWRVYVDVRQLAMSAFEANAELGPKTDEEWHVIVDNPLLDFLAKLLLTGTDSPLLKRQIDRFADGGLDKSQDLVSWLGYHLERSESLTRGGIGPSEAVVYVEVLVERNDDHPDRSMALVNAINGVLLSWHSGWDQPEIWMRIMPVRERLLKLVDWSIVHDPAGQNSRISRTVRDRLAVKP